MENVKYLDVTIEGRLYRYNEGTLYRDIAEDMQSSYPNDILLVKCNNKLQELDNRLNKPVNMTMLTLRDKPGAQTYERSAVFLMITAFYEVLGVERLEKIVVEFSTGNALYISAKGDFTLDVDTLSQVKQKMQEMVEQKLPITKETVDTQEALELFHQQKMYDKEKLLTYRRASKVNIYRLKDYIDYYYGYMLPDTSYIKLFDLQPYHEGFVLMLPTKEEPDKVLPFVPAEKVFEKLIASSRSYTELGWSEVGDLNTEISHGSAEDMILIAEAEMEKNIGDIAAKIASSKGIKFIMVAGPSSSGKTTFSHRLAIQLRAQGLKPHPIAVDDYFKNREDTPKDEDGNYDFECLEAIDAEVLNRDMLNLLSGKRVEMPTFNFKTGKREYRGRFLELGENDILILEGIHCLNDSLSYALPLESKFKIYISALTQLNIDEHNRIPTTDGRLIRRMVRDARTRGSSAQNTIRMWESVRRGEKRNIFPFQESADIVFNSALVYELAVLKQYAEPILFGIPKDSEEYIEAKRLLKFLDYFLGIPADAVPKNSILREFIGGSCFHA